MPEITSVPAPTHAPWLQAALRRIASATPLLSTTEIVALEGSTNEVFEVRQGTGPTWMVKRGRHDWQRDLFQNASLASRYLSGTGLRVPEIVTVEDAPGDLPVHVYRRVNFDTLRGRWPTLTEVERRVAYKSWGELIRRMHEIELPSAGPLSSMGTTATPVEGILLQDLAYRLLPTTEAIWPQAVRVVHRLLEALPLVAARTEEWPSVLLHSDLHNANILCEGEGESLRCVGLIDLDGAVSGPREADMANLQVLHGPYAGQPLGGDWFEQIRAGYAEPLDEQVLRFYRTLHLTNLGLYAAMQGYVECAAERAAAAWDEARRL